MGQLPGYPDITITKILWGSSLEGTVRDILCDFESDQDPAVKSAKQEAMDFLREELKDGPQPQEKIMQSAEDVGIAVRTLHRAKKALRVRSHKKPMAWF